MRGYYKPLPNIVFDPTIKEEDVLVGCKRCREYWYEKRNMSAYSFRINGPMYCYDYCDKCITDSDKQEQSDVQAKEAQQLAANMKDWSKEEKDAFFKGRRSK